MLDLGGQIVDNGFMSTAKNNLFLVQTGTTYNGWVPTYAKVEVPEQHICSYCNGYGLYDEGHLECDACDARGVTLSHDDLLALVK